MRQGHSLVQAQVFLDPAEFDDGFITRPSNNLGFPVSNLRLPAYASPFDMMTLTRKAAEELGKLLADRADSSSFAGLRLAVRKGGCAGWQYEMKVAEPEPGDVVVESGAARLIVAGDSLDRLRGCAIDYSDDLTDAGFKVLNPNAARSCGCGTSFEAADEAPGTHAVADGEACGTH
jgi:iron-sulfur cluster assembly protein